METSKNNSKFFFAAIAALLLIVSVIAIVPSASSSKMPDLAALRASLNPTEITPESNLYKYLHHVGTTEYPWTFATNASMVTSSLAPPCLTDHLLWKTFLGSLDWYNDPVGLTHRTIAITHGLAILGNTKTARDPMLYALDQNTGQLIWAAPGSMGNNYQIDEDRICIGSSVYRIETGQKLYDTKRTTVIYIAELKMAITSGPASQFGFSTYMGWDWSDTSKPPVEMYTTDIKEMPLSTGCQPCFGNGKVYVFDADNWLYAFDALTGKKVWGVQAEAASCTCAENNICYAYGRLYFGTYTASPTEHCYDAETGKMLWWAKLTGEQTRGQVIQDGVCIFQEMGSYFWALDAYDGHPIWKHLTQRQMPLLHSQNSAAGDLGPENYGKTSMHV